jgi:hypothetical protein
VVGMSMINKRIAVFILFLTSIVFLGVLVKNNTDNQVKESKAVGLIIEFENGTTESEVRNIHGKYNMTVNYSIDYNSQMLGTMYYTEVEENKMMNLREELKNVETGPYIKKGNY